MFWRNLALVSAVAIAICGPALADRSMERVFEKLEPEERAHQACDLKGLDAVRKGSKLRKIDRVKSSTSSRAIFKDNIVTAKGGAVRANHRWYALTFTCAVTDDQMKATSFDFKLGDEIPEDKWEDLGLWK